MEQGSSHPGKKWGYNADVCLIETNGKEVRPSGIGSFDFLSDNKR
jgi:hypothetical protein